MRKRRLMLMIAGGLATGLLSPTVASPALPDWSPSRSMVGMLRATPIHPIYLHPFQMRMPTDFVPQFYMSRDNAYAWRGPFRPDKTHAQIAIFVLAPPERPSNPVTYTLAQVMAQTLAGDQLRRTDWKQSHVERGVVNGQVFLRAYWAATEMWAGKPRRMHGFEYVTQEGREFARIFAWDYEPYSSATLPLAEASALTFEGM